MNNFLNNGKVLIGSRYDENPLKPKYIESDPDMIAIQDGLLGRSKYAQRERLANIAYMAVLVVAVVLGVIYS